MKVALYPHHHALPFWHSPEQPKIIFDPAVMADWTHTFEEWDKDQGKHVKKTVPLKDHWMWPVLMGLHSLDIPSAMAHVSVYFNKKTRTFELPKRKWVQISTLPQKTNTQGIPVVVSKGKVTVEHMWGGDNGTYTPYQLLSKETVEGEQTPEFWTNFFLTQLRETKKKITEKATATIQKSNKELEAFSAVL